MAKALFPPVSGRPARCAFTETRLKIGQRLEFQLTPTSLHPRLYTHLIGYEPGQSVLVATPRQGPLPVDVHEGQGLVLRAFSGTRAYAFETQVQRICISPFLYLHLAYPGEVQYLQIRKEARLPVRLLAEVEVDGHSHPALILDLGMGGALLETAHALGTEGKTVTLRFAIPVEAMQEEVPLTLSAQVLHVQRHESGNAPATWHHGVAFASPGKDERVMLQNFLFGILVEG